MLPIFTNAWLTQLTHLDVCVFLIGVLTKSTKACENDGIEYSDGTTFDIDKCTTCTCMVSAKYYIPLPIQTIQILSFGCCVLHQ